MAPYRRVGWTVSLPSQLLPTASPEHNQFSSLTASLSLSGIAQQEEGDCEGLDVWQAGSFSPLSQVGGREDTGSRKQGVSLEGRLWAPGPGGRAPTDAQSHASAMLPTECGQRDQRLACEQMTPTRYLAPV